MYSHQRDRLRHAGRGPGYIRGTRANGGKLSRAWAPIAASWLATKAGAFAPATICLIRCPNQADPTPKAPISPEVSAYGVKSLSLWGQNLTLWCHPHTVNHTIRLE